LILLKVFHQHMRSYNSSIFTTYSHAFFEGSLEDIASELNVLGVHAHRWLESDNVAMSASLSEEDTIILGFFVDCVEVLLVARSLRSLVLNKFKTDHETLASDIT